MFFELYPEASIELVKGRFAIKNRAHEAFREGGFSYGDTFTEALENFEKVDKEIRLRENWKDLFDLDLVKEDMKEHQVDAGNGYVRLESPVYKLMSIWASKPEEALDRLDRIPPSRMNLVAMRKAYEAAHGYVNGKPTFEEV